ncbi:MAG TPA: hypothetical protein PLP01_15155 [Phycisphaerae bacterium]|nr:hypothetical protein [Phycisphaerae bacterium]HOI56585.1 hypothetical protein [Phycisphaerae bacterium]
MPIPVTCIQCHKTFKASDSAAGRKAKCPACGHVIEIPAAPPGASEGPPAPTGHAAASPHPADALAAALAGAAGLSTPSVVGEEPEAVRPQPVRPEPVVAAPAVVSPPAAEADVVAPHAPGDEDEMITVPPIGVQTPSGLVVGRRGHLRQAVRRHRQTAAWARIVGMVLGGMCLVIGITGMIYLAIVTRALLTALGVFLLMLVLAAATVAGGMLARHLLLALADLTEQAAVHQDLLDEINERLS